jgi:hypothetical protein
MTRPFALYYAARFVRYIRAASFDAADAYAREHGLEAATLTSHHTGSGPDRFGFYPHNAPTI